MRYLLLSFVLPACLSALLPAQAAEFKSPKGFSLTCPDGWQIASEEQSKKMAEATKELPGKAPEYAARILGPQSGGFTPSIRVTVHPGNLVPKAKDEKGFAAAVQLRLEKGGKVLAMKTGHLTIGGETAFTMSVERAGPKSGKVIRHWIVMLPGTQRTYNITCTALKSQWNDVWKGFHETVLSFKEDPRSRR